MYLKEMSLEQLIGKEFAGIYNMSRKVAEQRVAEEIKRDEELTQRLLKACDEIEELQAAKKARARQNLKELLSTRVDVLLDDERFIKKPEGAKIGAIAKRLPQCKATISLKRLSEDVGNRGRSWKASVMSDTSNASYVSSSLVALDIDNKKSYTSVEDFMALEHKYEPCMVYETFSSTSERERFRVVYAFDSEVSNYDDMCLLYEEVQAQYPGVEFDLSVDPGKILFGGKKLRYFKNVVNKTPEFDALRFVSELRELDVEEDTPSHSMNEMSGEMSHVICANLLDMAEEYGNRIMKSSYEIKAYVCKIPLGRVLGLGVKVGEKFNCILDGHADNNASANIYLTKKNGYYMYKCFGCDSSFYLTDLVALETICEILNIRTLWYENNKVMIARNRAMLENPESMIADYKNVCKKVIAYYKLGSVMLDLAEEQLERLGRTFSTDKVDYVIVSERYATIARMIAEKFNVAVQADRRNVQNQLDMLMFMGFIVKLTDEELGKVNPAMLARNKKNIKSIDPKFNTQYGMMICKWDTVTALTDAEDMLKYYKASGATTLGASQRQSVELGVDTRSKNNKGDTEVILNIQQCLIDYYDECVNSQGYVLKDAFMAYAKENNVGRKLASTFIVKLNMYYGLTCATVNKDLISKYEELSSADSKKRIFIAAA